MIQLEKTTEFLKQLACNNNREWFTENKSFYLEAKEEFEGFIREMILLAKSIDPQIDAIDPKKCVFRVYRDVRFSKDKTPYKNHFGAFINPKGKKSPYSGYYIHIEPDASFIAIGTNPDPSVLPFVRNAIFQDAQVFKNILNEKHFKKYFNGIVGDKLKRPPKGFSKDYKDIDLLKHKHYAMAYEVKDAFWNSPKLDESMKTVFEVSYPFNRYLNSALGLK